MLIMHRLLEYYANCLTDKEYLLRIPHGRMHYEHTHCNGHTQYLEILYIPYTISPKCGEKARLSSVTIHFQSQFL